MLSTQPETVAVIAFDGISPFHLSVPCLVFGEDRAPDRSHRFELCVCAQTPGPLRTNAGFAIQVAHGLEVLQTSTIIVVPSWFDDTRPAPAELLDALRKAHRRGATIVGLCLGAFVLAEAGLLQGRTATTHWHLAERFAEQYPEVAVQPEVLYVDHGDVLTSAGTAAGIDCCLHLLRVRHGADAANRAARRMVVAPHRQGGQAQYIETPVRAAPERDRLTPVVDWMLKNLQQPHDLDTLAQKALMSRRSFTRNFRETMGTPVGQWLQHQRLALAQRLLETTGDSIEVVADKSGFGTAVSLRKHFAAALQVSPLAYRKQFRDA